MLGSNSAKIAPKSLREWQEQHVLARRESQPVGVWANLLVDLFPGLGQRFQLVSVELEDSRFDLALIFEDCGHVLLESSFLLLDTENGSQKLQFRQ